MSVTFSQNLPALAALRAPFHISHIKQFPPQPRLRKKIGFAVVTDNTKGAGRKIRDKEKKAMVEMKVLLHGFSHFLLDEKLTFLLNSNMHRP